MEKHRLLNEDEEVEFRATSGRKHQQNLFAYMSWALFTISLLANVLQYFHARSDTQVFTIFRELQYPRTVIKHEHPEHGQKFSDFDGSPSNISAKAWRELLQPFYFNISESELVSAGFSPESSVRVKDGGYLASLAVYHELHCLNQFRTFLYTRTDPDRFSKEDVEYWHGHLGHCIEVLRLSLMCSADLSLYTFTWPTRENFTFLDAHSKTPRKCRDWSQIEEWSMRRKISLTPTVLFPGETEEMVENVEESG